MTDKIDKSDKSAQVAMSLAFLGPCGHMRQRGPYHPDDGKMLPCATPGCREGWNNGHTYHVAVAPTLYGMFSDDERPLGQPPPIERYTYHRFQVVTEGPYGETIVFLWRWSGDL